MTLIPKGCQHGAKLDAQTHQTIMPKQVTEMIAEFNEFLMFRNMRIYFQNNYVILTTISVFS